MYRLIIIDDEPKIAEGMAQLFPWNNIGFEVVRSFTSAAEALEYLEQNPVDVVLSDIQMPDMTGLELCQRLLGREKTQVVLFSSYQNYEYFRSAIQMGVADYLLKPLTYQALTETFAKLKEKLDEMNPAGSEQPVGYYEGLIQQVDEYLRGHLQDATLTRCAKRVALSPSYLSRIYKEYSGKNFVDRLLELWTYNDYFNSLVFINSATKYTVSLGLRLSLDGESVVNWGKMMAASCIAVLPLIILFFAAQKYFVEGIATTGMKG